MSKIKNLLKTTWLYAIYYIRHKQCTYMSYSGNNLISVNNMHSVISYTEVNLARLIYVYNGHHSKKYKYLPILWRLMKHKVICPIEGRQLTDPLQDKNYTNHLVDAMVI